MNNLRKIRHEKKITMKEVATAIGVAESTISLYETGKHQPDFETLKKLSNYYSVSIDYILNWEIPKIQMSNFEYDMSAWYLDKTNSALKTLANISDYLNEAEKTSIKDTGIKEIKNYIKILARTLLTIFTVSLGREELLNNEDSDILTNEGTKGLKKLYNKYKTTDKELNSLFNRQ